MSPHDDKSERSKGELEAENLALRAQLAAKDNLLETRDVELKLNHLRVKSHEAKISKLKGSLETKDDFIGWILKQLQGPKSERRSWESLEPGLQLWLEGMALELPKSPPKPNVSVKDSEKKRRKSPIVTKTGRLRHGRNVTILDFDAPNPEVSSETLRLRRN